MEEAPGTVRSGNVRRCEGYPGSFDLEGHAGGQGDLAGTSGGEGGGGGERGRGRRVGPALECIFYLFFFCFPFCLLFLAVSGEKGIGDPTLTGY